MSARRSNGQEINFITLMYGEDVTEAEAEEAAAGIRAKLGDDADITVLSGGQPVYYYIISVE